MPDKQSENQVWIVEKDECDCMQESLRCGGIVGTSAGQHNIPDGTLPASDGTAVTDAANWARNISGKQH